jgi:hypothetical protein
LGYVIEDKISVDNNMVNALHNLKDAHNGFVFNQMEFNLLYGYYYNNKGDVVYSMLMYYNCEVDLLRQGNGSKAICQIVLDNEDAKEWNNETNKLDNNSTDVTKDIGIVEDSGTNANYGAIESILEINQEKHWCFLSCLMLKNIN